MDEVRFTFSRQLLLTSRFPGLMSRCRIPAECRYFRPEGEKASSLSGAHFKISNLKARRKGRFWLLACRTQPLTSEDLVEEDLDVVGCKRLGRHDHFVKVALHQLCDDVSVRFGVKAKRAAIEGGGGLTFGEHRARRSRAAKLSD